MQAAKRNPYAVLGLRPGANAAEARAAFRVVAKSCHPDLNPGDAAARERFEEAHAAYARISAVKKLVQELNASPAASPAPAAPSAKAETQPAARRSAAQARPRDSEPLARLTLTLSEAVQGCVKRVRRGGTSILVRAPRGVRDGDRLVAQGPDGRPTPILVRVQPDEDFRIVGADLHGFLFLPADALGTDQAQAVDTPHGVVKVRVPAAAGFGARIRVRERGLPARAGAAAGDLYLELRLAPASGSDLLSAVGKAAKALGLDLARLRRART
jgi:curved DNA-binding protein CbpA